MTTNAVAEYYRTQDYDLHDETTVVQIVESAIKQRGAEEGCPIVYRQGSFWRYDPHRGFFRRTCHSIVKREISEVLPRIRKVLQNPQREIKQFATTPNVKAATTWLETRLGVQEVNAKTAIAFKNGTLYYGDQGWELGEHSPSNNLTYGIEGDWSTNAECPPIFHEFIRTSYGLDWLHIMRAVVAYHLDSRYGCKVITMIVGNSGTGKGVFERLIESFFPKDAIGMIPSGFKELNSPEKIAQYVAGRRLIVFPDLQGHQDGLGTALSLTDGGNLTARPLYSTDTTQFIFDGRVLICATQAPVMENAGVGFARRFLILQTLGKRLSSTLLPADGQEMERLLHAERGQIGSWALQMPEEDVMAVLQMKDPGGLLKDAKIENESRMDATRLFLDSALVPCESIHIPDMRILYQAFRLFCTATGHKGCSQGSFNSRVRQALPHLHRGRKTVPGSNSREKIPPMFFGFDLRQGLWSASETLARESMESYSQRKPEHKRNSSEPACSYENEASIVGGARHERFGYLVQPLLMEGQLEVLNDHHPEEPTYEQLLSAGYLEPKGNSQAK